jgi:hypothetical protein
LLAASRIETLTFEPGSKLKRITSGAFLDCLAIRSLSLPASVETIEEAAFGLNTIAEITVESGNRHFRTLKDFLTDFAGRVIIYYFGRNPDVIVPSCIEVLGPFSHAYARRIATVSFESGSQLRRIGDAAFACSGRLRSICIPASVEIICGRSFEDCASLEAVTFEADSMLKVLEDSAFLNCAAISQLRIPRLLEVLQGNAFDGCTSLSSLTFGPQSRLREIAGFAPWQWKMTEFDIPDSVERLSFNLVESDDGLARGFVVNIGLESRLRELGKIQPVADQVAAFVRLHEQTLRRFREDLEAYSLDKFLLSAEFCVNTS